jgi:subtilisin family serine protease/subtilisin-like proprotein convertase family protein
MLSNHGMFGARRPGSKQADRPRKRTESKLQLESLEDRRLLAIVDVPTAGTPVPITTTDLSTEVAQAFHRSSNLSQYTANELAGATQWVVNLRPGTSPLQLANALGIPATRLVVPSWIRNTFIVETGGIGQLSNTQLRSRLDNFAGDRFFYPLVGESPVPDSIPNDPFVAEQWGLLNFGQIPNGKPGEDANLPAAWARYDGTGVQLAVLDDSIQGAHPDLAGNFRSDLSFNYLTNVPDPSPDGSEPSHGTAVSGIAAGVGNNSVGIAGAAYNADLVGLRILGDQYSDFKLSQALTHRMDEIDVYNNSYGPVSTTYFGQDPLVVSALEAGATQGRGGLGANYIFSAGNDRLANANTNYTDFTNSIYTLAIGAVDHRGEIATYSTPGASLFAVTSSQGDFGEPGILTTDITGSAGYNGPGIGDAGQDDFSDFDYTSTFNGTSASAPLASGIVALMLQANPGLSYRDIQHIIARTARKIDPGSAGWRTNGDGFHVHHDYGFGAIDAAAAVKMAEVWARVPTMQSIAFDVPSTFMFEEGVTSGVNFLVRLQPAAGDELFSIEHVQLQFTGSQLMHRSPGSLSIRLISPTGTVSELADAHSNFAFPEDGFGGFSWTFSSVHHWGENIPGVWRVVVDDLDPNIAGSISGFRLNFTGTTSNIVYPTLSTVNTSSIVGTVYNDLNANSTRDDLEPGLVGRTIYLDINENRVLDASEPSTVSKGNGLYVFTELAAGTYTVRLRGEVGFTQTSPLSNVGRTVSVLRGARASGIDFGSVQTGGNTVGTGIGKIRGKIYLDTDGDGTQDSGETGVAGLSVYADLNRNCVIGLGEPTAVTDASGNFTIRNLSPGSYSVKLVSTPGYMGTGGCTDAIVSINAIGVASMSPAFPVTRNFNNNSGSSPPINGIDQDFRLGATISPDPTVNDNDGIFFITGLHPGRDEQIGIIARQFSVSPGFFHGWIDFNGDGDFSDAGEQVFQNERLVDGLNTRTIRVPTNVATGNVRARFRWVLEANLNPTDIAISGETEDYTVTIPFGGSTGLSAVDDTTTVAEDSDTTAISVLANDTAGIFGGAITLIGVGSPDQGGTATINNGAINYKPAANFNGTETFTYMIRDSLGGMDTATVTVTVTSVNDAPTAANDDFMVIAGTANQILDVLDNDRSNPDSGETLSIISFTDPTGGGSLNVGTGGTSLLYTPGFGFEGIETFQYTISDGNGGEATATVTLDVIPADPIMRIRFDVTNSASVPVSQVLIGESFLLRVLVEDIRANPQGVFSTYMDILYNSSIASASGAISYGPSYGNAKSGSTATPGLIDEVGATAGAEDTTSPPLGAGEFLLFTVPFVASAEGVLNFDFDGADNLPLHDILIFGNDSVVNSALIDIVEDSVTVSRAGVQDDTADVNEDTTDNVLKVTDNDLPASGFGPFEIVQITALSSGGMATTSPNRKDILYTPAKDFFGVETFSYTVRDIAGNLQTASVTVNVANRNDPPIARDDTFFNVTTNSSQVLLNVLFNDTFLPDPPENLTITQTGGTSSGGSLTITADRKAILYQPLAGFTGTESFTYTISDGNSATSTASVRINVGDELERAAFMFEVTDLEGTPINQIAVGGDFLVNVFVQDLREVPDGVFSAYLDMVFESAVSVTGTLANFQFSSDYPTARSGVPGTGMIDELGATDGSNSSVIDPIERLVTIPFRANSVGQVRFTGNVADNIPQHETSLFGEPTRVADDDITFGFDTLEVIAAGAAQFTNSVDIYDVNEDGNVNPLDALIIINDLTKYGPRRLTAGNAGHMMLDVNSDGYAAPLDALLVINQLSRQGGSRAASGIVVTSDDDLTPMPAPAATAGVINAISTDADGQGLHRVPTSNIGSAWTHPSNETMMARRVVGPHHEMESILGDIADDVCGAWSR